MTEEVQSRQKRRSKLWLVPAVLAVVVAIIVIPPLVNVNRYKSQITNLMSASLRRPVRLSSVELRVLPRPGFPTVSNQYSTPPPSRPPFGSCPYGAAISRSAASALMKQASIWSELRPATGISIPSFALRLRNRSLS